MATQVCNPSHSEPAAQIFTLFACSAFKHSNLLDTVIANTVCHKIFRLKFALVNISPRDCLRKFKFLSKILLILDEYRYFSTIKRVLDRNIDLIQLFQLLQNRILYFCTSEFAVECNKQTSSEIWNFPSEEGSEFLNFSFHRSLRSATG